jgi:hypothetical protein
MNTQEIIQKINAGAFDADFAALQTAIANRAQVLKSAKLNAIKAGDLVYLNAKCSPRYMAGRQATVVSWSDSKVRLKLVQPIPSSRFQDTFVCPLALIDLDPSLG